MVVTSRSRAALSGVTHERTGLPSMRTVQAPQIPAPQPYLAPVSPRSVRSTQRSLRLSSVSREAGRPLRRNWIDFMSTSTRSGFREHTPGGEGKGTAPTGGSISAGEDTLRQPHVDAQLLVVEIARVPPRRDAADGDGRRRGFEAVDLRRLRVQDGGGEPEDGCGGGGLSHADLSLRGCLKSSVLECYHPVYGISKRRNGCRMGCHCALAAG